MPIYNSIQHSLEAIQLTNLESAVKMYEWVKGDLLVLPAEKTLMTNRFLDTDKLVIPNNETSIEVNKFDYLAKDLNGNFFVIDCNRFESMYEKMSVQ